MIGVMLLGTLVLWFGLAWMVGRDIRSGIGKEQERLGAIAQTWQEIVEQIVGPIDRGLVLARDRVAKGRDPQEAVDTAVWNSAIRSEVVWGLLALDAKGKVRGVARALRAQVPVGADFGGNPLFSAHIGSGVRDLWISPTVEDPLSKRPIITFARRVDAPDGSLLGAVVAAVSVDYLAEVLSILGREPGMNFGLYGTDGLIRFRQDVGAPIQFGGTLPAKHPLKAFASGQKDHEQGISAHGLVSGLRIYALRRIRDRSIVVAVGSSAQNVVADVIDSWAVGIGGISAATLLLWWGVVAALRSLVRSELNRELLRRALLRSQSGERAKAAFLGNLSHELRTPLTGILGYASFIERLSAEDRIRDMGGTVRRSAERLTSLLNDSLDAARIEAGVMRVEIADSPVREIVLEAAALFEPTARAKGVHLVADVDEAVPQTVRCDGSRLRQVMHNLLSNALKFTESGAIRVEASIVDGDLRITVADTGCGIAPEALGRIFERFQQANDSVARHHGGTGLGLALARDFMQRMGGGIVAASEPGRGTTMTVTLLL